MDLIRVGLAIDGLTAVAGARGLMGLGLWYVGFRI